ncbi:MAG: TIGR01244 family sulfur transferase [Rhodobacter sp.]|nr:TIGR01244 family sulfur transferase [Rhodobacter sp.]
MTPTHLDDDLAVSGQIGAGDIARLAASGVRAIICNRPDGEEPGQPPFAEIENAAEAAGIEARYVPVSPSGATPADVQDMKQALDGLPRPLLAYCRSGARSRAILAAAGAK